MRLAGALILCLVVFAGAVLVAVVPNLYLMTRRSDAAAEVATADAIAATLRDRPAGDDALEALRLHSGAARIALRSTRDGALVAAAGATQRMSHTESRPMGALIVDVDFDRSRVMQADQLLRIATAATAVALIGAILLLIGYSIGGSRSAAGARDGEGATGSYLFSTFEASMRTMKGRESELRHLHDVERARANEMTSITNTLVRSITSGFISIDERGLLLDLNQAARELTGVLPGDPIAGRTIEEVLGDTPFTRKLAAAVAERRTLQREEIVENAARPLVIGLSTVPLVDEMNRYVGMLALFTDLTPIRLLENRVRTMQSLADIGEMSAGIAHEFRNSLAAVIGYIRLARKESLPAVAEQRMRNAEEEARSLTDAVEKLLAFTRPFTLNKERVDLLAVVKPIVERLRILHPSIRFEMTNESAHVDGDAALLSRAFENILLNAVDAVAAIEREAHIEVLIRDTPAPMVIVRDNGVGLADEDAQRLLLPFQSTKPNGYGLGLFLTRKIVLLHDGTIELTGRKGLGATVTIAFFPAAP
jgi:signal transduction histidine kinase